MKKYLITLSLFLFIFGCTSQPKEKTVFIKVNNYDITKSEFEEEFKDSSFGRTDTIESRKDFLENLINRKLILQEAEKQGLDKEKNFLKLVERFWEQSLLKTALDKKSKEIAGSVVVTEKSIEEAYRNMIKDKKTDETYSEIRGQIMREISQVKESRLMNDWIAKLRKEADIKINYDLLK